MTVSVHRDGTPGGHASGRSVVSTPEFFQDPPRLGNQFDDDALLRSFLRWRLPSAVHRAVEPGLRRLGARAATDLLALADAAEAQPPRHVPYDAWGRRIDDIEVSDAWRALDVVSAEEGIVAAAYAREHGPWSRVDQMARLYLFHPSSALYSCPLAMTDGAARFLEVYGDDRTRAAYDHLVSSDPEQFWTSGQWMTERTGGSDVSRTSTIARPTDDPRVFTLHGVKWFTSATTSQVAFALARIEGAPEGGRGLSVFMIELRDSAGALQGIRVERLKEKLGTRALPTAELTLEGTPALLVGGAGDGVRKIASLFNVTRAYNSVCAVAGMRRALAIARDYAHRRQAFGRALIDHPLHRETLDDLDARFHACFELTFHVAELMGRDECGIATDAEQAMLRLLTPVAKLYTAKQGVAVVSEAIECMGGAGYIEDTGMPRLLRDAQVLPIWEGTTNVLSLDVLRAIEKTSALAPWVAHVAETMGAIRAPALRDAATRVAAAAAAIDRRVAADVSRAEREAGARRLAFAIGRTAGAARLVEHAEADGTLTTVALRWANRTLEP